MTKATQDSSCCRVTCEATALARTALGLLALLVLAVSVIAPVSAGAPKLPEGFVYLSDVDATIAEDIRYAGAHNFMGRPSPGYEGAACVLTVGAAKALSRAQTQLAKDGLSLKVYDCYRPARAVRDFKKWSQATGDEAMKAEFYPENSKRDLFSLGYIASRSVHSRGCAIDLTIGPAKAEPVPVATATPAGACTAKLGERFHDGTLDMGTAYDCFSDLSRTSTRKVSEHAQRNRATLVRIMSEAGFKNYAREWWHYEITGSCSPSERDFPIPPRTPQRAAERIEIVVKPDQPAAKPDEHAAKPVEETEKTDIQPSKLVGATPKVDQPAANPDRPPISCPAWDVIPNCLTEASVHEEPGSASRVIASIANGAAGIECLRCEAAQATVQATKEDWCLIEFYVSGASRLHGWVQRRRESAKGEKGCGP